MSFDWRGLPPSLVNLLRGYATLISVRSLKFPLDLPFNQVHSFLLDGILTNAHFAKYPPAQQYQQQFWKWALANLESMPLEEDDEIDSRMYEHHVSLMSQSAVIQATGSQPPTPSYFTYMWRSGSIFQRATLMESRTTIESGTTGLKTWRACLALAQYLITYPDVIHNKRILELGSGTGLLGIIIATLQMNEPRAPTSIYLTDVNAEVLARCAANLALECNKSSMYPATTTSLLDWTDSLAESGVPNVQGLLREAAPDLILGADVVYDPSIIPPLVETLFLALQDGHTTAIIALTERNENTMSQFIQNANDRLMLEELTPDLADLESFWGVVDSNLTTSDRRVRLFLLRSKNT